MRIFDHIIPRMLKIGVGTKTKIEDENPKTRRTIVKTSGKAKTQNNFGRLNLKT